MPRLDIYWSFRSPYSYLATDRLVRIAEDYAVDARFRPVRPLALREADFFARSRPQFLPYLFRDVLREAERLGIPFFPPRPDPIRMDMASGKVDPEQPLMTRIMSLAVAACQAGRGLPFARAVARRIWGGAENWCEAGPLGQAAEEAGLDLAGLERWAASHPADIEETIAENEREQSKHHWGVPLMVLDDEPFFGQDRIEALLWRLDRRGLKTA